MLQPGFFWDEQRAVAERERLQRLNADSPIRYLVIEGEASVMFPDDDPPPWVADLDWKRGYEQPPDQ